MKQPKYRQSETELLEQIVEVAHYTGWKVAHFRAARTQYGWVTPVSADGKGFPDTVLAKRGRQTLFWEVKGEDGKVTPEQQEWLDILGGRVVRPSDWEEIVKILKGEANG